MSKDYTRRRFLHAAGVGAAATAAYTSSSAVAANDEERAIKIIGISTSLRKGKTTAAAVNISLEAAQALAPDRIQVELIDLAPLSIPAAPAAGLDLKPGEEDDFPAVAEKLSDPAVAGIIVGTPVYFGNMSSLCKAFIERLMTFRRNDFALANRVGGVVAVGGARHGGQEVTIRSVQQALFAQEMVIVGESRPTAHSGGTLWNNAKDQIEQDEPGVATAKNLGRRVAEVALAMRF
jgi:multimeric flavodoxin WrbA